MQNLFICIKFTINLTPPVYLGIIRAGLINFLQVAGLIALDYFYLSVFHDYTYEPSKSYCFIKNGLMGSENQGITPNSMLCKVTTSVLIFFQNYKLFLTV